MWSDVFVSKMLNLHKKSCWLFLHHKNLSEIIMLKE